MELSLNENVLLTSVCKQVFFKFLFVCFLSISLQGEKILHCHNVKLKVQNQTLQVLNGFVVS